MSEETAAFFQRKRTSMYVPDDEEDEERLLEALTMAITPRSDETGVCAIML